MEGAPGTGDGQGAAGELPKQGDNRHTKDRRASVVYSSRLRMSLIETGLSGRFAASASASASASAFVQCPSSARPVPVTGTNRVRRASAPVRRGRKKCTICRRLQEQARTGRSRPKPPFQLPKLRVVGSSPIARFEIVPAIARFRRSYARAVEGRGLRGVGWILGVTGLVPASRMPRASAALTICSVPPTTRVYERCTRSSLRPRAARSQTSAGRPRGSGRRRSGADHAGPRPAARLLSRRAVRPFG